MERPELLNVGLSTDLRKRYRSTQKQLERVMLTCLSRILWRY